MMDKHTPVSDYMTAEPVTLLPSDTMQQAADIFKDGGFHHIPVVSADGFLKGMLSYTDYMRVLRSIYDTPAEQHEEHRYLNSVLVQDVMTQRHHLVSLNERATLEDAVRLFRANQFHALAILDQHGKLAGIITVHDMIKILGDHYLQIR
jgi:CBS domain-containing protein